MKTEQLVKHLEGIIQRLKSGNTGSILYFKDDPEGLGVEFFNTPDEAHNSVVLALDHYAQDAQRCHGGVWPDYAGHVFWGLVIEQAKEIRDEEDGCWYELRPL